MGFLGLFWVVFLGGFFIANPASKTYLSIGVEIGIEPDSAVPCSHQAHPRRSEIYQDMLARFLKKI